MKQVRLLGMTAALLSGFWLGGCGQKIEPGTTAGRKGAVVKAVVQTVEESRQPILYEAVGTISARTSSTISSKLMGTVLAVHVNEGDEVREGAPLVTLDKRQVAAQLDGARAGLGEAKRAESSAVSARDAARAAAQLGSATFERYARLMKDKSVSLQEFEEVQARYLQAKASLAQAEAMLAAAQSRIQQAEAAVREALVAEKDAQVLAPYAGKVINKMIAVGDLASPGTPFLTIERQGIYCADLELPERYIQEIALDQEVRVSVEALKTEVTGRIGRIVPSADARSRSFQVKVGLPEGLNVKSGMFARVFVPIGGTGMLLLPSSAVVHEGQLTGVFVVDDQQRARFRLVRTGRQIDARMEIISGLSAGQRYVADVPRALQDGDSIEPQGSM